MSQLKYRLQILEYNNVLNYESFRNRSEFKRQQLFIIKHSQTGMDFVITINKNQLKIQEQRKCKVKNTCAESFNLEPTQ